MDNDHPSGTADKIAGSMKEAIGKVTGDTRLQAEGTAQKAGGAAEDVAGDAEGTLGDTVKE